MNLSVLTGTCDKYLKFVPHFLTLYHKYFEPDVAFILVGEQIQVETNVQYLTPGALPWGARMLKGLDEIKTDYVFFLLEDYYLSQPLTTNYFEWLLTFMDRQKAKKLILSVIPPEAKYTYTDRIDTMKRMDPNSNWLTSVQPAIWRTSHLRTLMLPEYSPWAFEVDGSEALRGKETDHWVAALDEPIYFNAASKRAELSYPVMQRGWQAFFEKEKLSPITIGP